jgi:TonB dependent receptor-like, beta-barrel/Carboxypeptidase regulatory-like domain
VTSIRTARSRLLAAVAFSAICVLVPRVATAQGLTGTLIGTVKDPQGGVLSGAVASVTSAALIGRELRATTNEKGQLRFPALPPGSYALDIEMTGFATYHEVDIRIGAGATIERNAVLSVAGVDESVTVQGAGSHIEARGSGFETRFGPDDLRAIPTGRFSMFDFIRAAPGISPTSPSSGTTTSLSATSVSAFGSGVNENQFLLDGTNFTCPCSGLARSEPGVDFIQEVQVQSVGASAEYGNLQGAVINIITRQGSDTYQYDASYYSQSGRLTSQPVVRPVQAGSQPTSGYSRKKYNDFTTNAGGPVVRDRLWFFGGYQYLRDYDSQPGVDPKFPRTYEQDKGFVKLTWRFTPSLQLMQSLHQESWVNPPPPTVATPFEATTRNQASVPAITFGHLTHTVSTNTLWDARVARFVVSEKRPPNTGNLTTASHFDRVSGIRTGAPETFGGRNYFRTTAKATLTHYETALFGADHQWKLGGSLERGEHRHAAVLPGGVGFIDNNGQPFQSVSRDPFPDGGLSITASAFASDAITIGDRLTLNLGVRFDHSRAISQDLPALDSQGGETDASISGLGTLYTWNIVSPRLGIATKLTADGRTMLRASYGRFSQGVLTGEFGAFHTGISSVTTRAFDPLTSGYTTLVSVVDPKMQLQLDRGIKAPHSDEYSLGVEREVGRQVAVSAAYVRKDGTDFIGWTDVGGQYRQETRPLPDGSSVPVMVLVNSTAARRFLLTNPAGYSLTYNGLVTTLEKRRSHGWHAFGSYTFSRAYGLQVSSGTAAVGEQLSTLTSSGVFGRDPNDLQNARGRLANDRPHMFRVMGSVEVPHTGFTVAANVQHFSGKPWAASTRVSLPQGDRRILLEPPGSRRLSSQSLLDLRVSRMFRFSTVGRVVFLMDVLNLLNDTAEEGLVTDNRFGSTFGEPNLWVSPRRVILGARLNLGR